MYSKVRIKKSALDYFRRQARQAFPKEIQAYLLGTINSVNEITITDFVSPINYDTQTSEEVGWNRDEFLALKQRAIPEHKSVVGDIHSHPSWPPIMSGADYRGAIIDSLLVCGICSVYNNRTTVYFWTPTSSLPCEIIYS
jgi:proteasome lid subunit RPN8/RPN11